MSLSLLSCVQQGLNQSNNLPGGGRRRQGGGGGGEGTARDVDGGGEDLLAAPVLPADVLDEAIPGNIRNAQLFLRLMRTIVTYLKVVLLREEECGALLHGVVVHGCFWTMCVVRVCMHVRFPSCSTSQQRLQVREVESESPMSFLHNMRQVGRLGCCQVSRRVSLQQAAHSFSVWCLRALR